MLSDPNVLSNIFNEYFSTLGSKVQEKIPPVKGSFEAYLKKKSDDKLIINPDGRVFFLSPCLLRAISDIIVKLDENKSTGPNGIPVFLLKTFNDFFSKILSKLINLSFEKGVFPDLLKMAKVIPLHKKGSKFDHLNYRPISLLSVFSKIYEKLIYSRLYSYLTKYNLIYQKQFGFRSSYSTNHAIISITEHIRRLLDDGELVCGIFVDLEKAFDTVLHDIFCEKLKAYGLRGKINDLLKSYLKDRKQFVSIQGSHSNTKKVTCGVPQGSSLGPLLFLIYINDLRFCLSKTSAGHFADDTFIIFNSKKLKTIETVVNTELKEVSKWLRLNKLSLNVKKTELIFFHSPFKKVNYDKIFIKFNDLRLQPVDFVKYLGMFIDKFLNWNHHILELCKKLSRANEIISKLRCNNPLSTCIQVYYVLFYSHMSYGCNVWGLSSQDNIKRVEVLQKKCVRIMTFSEPNSHTDNIFNDLNLLKVRDVLKISQLKLNFQYLRNLLPHDLLNLFNLNHHVIKTSLTLRSMSNDTFYIPPIRTTAYGIKSIRFHCSKLWNEVFVNGEIRVSNDTCIKSNDIMSINVFNSVVKRHFFFLSHLS